MINEHTDNINDSGTQNISTASKMAAASFDDAIDVIIKQLSIPVEEHSDFINDIGYITCWINMELKERKSVFAGTFSNLPATATYICDDVIDIPIDFNCYLLLDLKIPIYLKMDIADDSVYLQSIGGGKKPEENGLAAANLQNQLRKDLFFLLKRVPKINCTPGTNRSYQLCYHTTAYPISRHTIIATQLGTEKNARIVFEFLVGIKLPMDQNTGPSCVTAIGTDENTKMGYWVALPKPHFDAYYNATSYVGRRHVWELASATQLQKWGVVVRLLYTLSYKNGTMDTVGAHLLKHLSINLCEEYGVNCDRSLGAMLLDLMFNLGNQKLKEVAHVTEMGKLIICCTHPSLSLDCGKMSSLYYRLKENLRNGVHLDTLQRFFGLATEQKPETESDE